MTNNKQTWREEYKLRYVPNCGDDEVCIAFWKDNMDYIEKTLQNREQEIREEIEQEILKETMNTSRDEWGVRQLWKRAVRDIKDYQEKK